MEGIRAIARIASADGSHGTGFLVSDRLVLTAFHVLADRATSLARRAAIWRPGPLAVQFGDPQSTDTLWKPTSAAPHPVLYSIERDWAVLEIEPPDGLAAVTPFGLTAYAGDHAAFETFGFPTKTKDIGGVYVGTILNWQADTGEIDAENLIAEAAGGENAGGISGAPVVVGKRVVGIILRSLGTARTGQAITRSLYALPIERAIDSLRGLVEWDGTEEVEFEREVAGTLPQDPLLLGNAARALRFRATERPAIARRLLKSGIEAACSALETCNVKGTPAGGVMDRVAAMSIHAEAARAIYDARPGQPGAVAVVTRIASVEPRIHRWYVMRAFHGNPRQRSNPVRTVVMKALPSSAAELASGTPVDHYVGRARAHFKANRVLDVQITEMLSPTAIEKREWWLALIDENRPDVIAALRDRLPNAQLIIGLATAEPFPAPNEALVVPIAPVMTPDEQGRLISEWADAATTLEVVIEEKSEP